MDVRSLSSNWKQLKASLVSQPNSQESQNATNAVLPSPTNHLKRKRSVLPPKHEAGKKRDVRQAVRKSSKRPRLPSTMSHPQSPSNMQNASEIVTTTSTRTDCINGGFNAEIQIGKYLAIDCEMVGIGPPPHLESALARVSIVNYDGDCVYDSYVKPIEEVTDWRTHVSGIAPKHMIHARSFEEVQADVAALIKNTILVGHSIRGDFNVLLLSHPMRDIRDTARHPPYRKIAGGGSPKLKILASELLGLDIQAGEHSSIEDARATMLLFRRDKDAFEREHSKRWPTKVVSASASEQSEHSKKPKKKKKKRR